MSTDDIAAGLAQAADRARRRIVAYHEAGHALVGVLLGQGLVKTGMDGHTHFDEASRCERLMSSTEDLSADDRQFLVARAKIAFAGSAGEAVGLGGAHPLGPTNDIKQAGLFLRRIGPRGTRPNAQDLNVEVQQIVADNEPALHKLANALLGEGTLSADMVRALIAEAHT